MSIREMVNEKLKDIVNMDEKDSKEYDTIFTFAFLNATRPSKD